MTTLREFIASRQSDIADQMAALKRESRELKIALAALGGDNPKPNVSAGSRRPTIKQMIVAVLGEFGGATSESIIGLVKENHDVDVPRSSMSPQLSRLKNDGVVEFDGQLWRLASESQPPDGNGADADATAAEDNASAAA